MFGRSVFAEILKLNIGVSQGANEEAFRLMGSVHPLKLKNYRSGREHNGWVIPHDWIVKRATIQQAGRVLFDGMVHPMAVAGNSCSFKGTLSRGEMFQHVFTREDFPDAYPFHCMYNYRPWQQHWGFCVPHNTALEWTADRFDVHLDAELREGQMLVAECQHQGRLQETIVFNAHTCHPCQANDDMSGVMVILQLFQWLSSRSTRYTYLGILAPEHLGTVFYLAEKTPEEVSRFKLGCFVEMVGTNGPLRLQESFTGESIIDRVATQVLKRSWPDVQIGPFRSVVGNDETVWEAPGIEVPMISLSRWPYPEYHTSADNLHIISDERLDEALEVLKGIVEVLEEDRTMERRFRGLLSLANPKYDLYIERPDPVVKKDLDERMLVLGRLQDYLPRFFDGTSTVFDIAERFGVDFHTLRAYLDRWEALDLIRMQPLDSLDTYRGLVPELVRKA